MVDHADVFCSPASQQYFHVTYLGHRNPLGEADTGN